MDKREPCTVSLRGAEWNALVGVFDRAQKLLTALENERILHSATRDEMQRLNEAYQHYHDARVRIEADYMQRDTLDMRLKQNDPVRWLMDAHGYQCKALDDLVELCKRRGFTLSRWKSKHKVTRKTNVRWAVHRNSKATRLEFQPGVVAWFELSRLEYEDEAASRSEFEQMLEVMIRAQGA